MSSGSPITADFEVVEVSPANACQQHAKSETANRKRQAGFIAKREEGREPDNGLNQLRKGLRLEHPRCESQISDGH